MEDLYLIYIHEIGANHKDIYFYEFMYSDSIDNIDGEGWDEYPAGGNPYPPKDLLIQQVATFNTSLQLTLVRNNEQFSMWDSVDGVIPLGWENIDGLDDYPTKRLIFPFGMKLKDAQALLYERDITIKYEKKFKNE
jgi:hypothetical protein